MPLRILKVGVGASSSRKFTRPRRQLAIGIAILRRDELDEIGEFLVVIEERIEIGRIIRPSARIPPPDCARPLRSLMNDSVGRDRSSKVAIATLLPNTSWIQRSDAGCGSISRLARQHAQIMAVARAQHDAVFAERHRVRYSDIRSCDGSSVAASLRPIIVISGALIYTDPCLYPGRHAASIGNASRN